MTATSERPSGPGSSPNTTFDLVGAYLPAGSALDTLEVVNGVPTKREAEDGWTVAARVRLSF
jgi:hypothetical protein